MNRITATVFIVGILVATFFTGFLLRDKLPQPKEEKKTTVAKSQPGSGSLVDNRTEEIESGEYIVAKVLDGDTIDLTNGVRIRYEGIDAPEKNESYGLDALADNQKLVSQEKIWVEVAENKTDAFGRTLAYVWVDNILVNERLVEDGYATVYIHLPTRPPKYLKQLQEAETRARQNGRGMWIEEKMKRLKLL